MVVNGPLLKEGAGGYIMKSLRFTLLNSLIFLGLCLGMASFAFAGQTPAINSWARKAPVVTSIQNYTSLVKDSLSSLGQTSLTCAKAGLAGATLALGVSAYYLYKCRKIDMALDEQWNEIISNAEAETKALDETHHDVAAGKNKFRYWGLKFGSACEIFRGWKRYYSDMRILFPVYGNKAHFVKVTKDIIEEEKTLLKSLYRGLNKYFSENTLLPRMSRYSEVFDNPVRSLTKHYETTTICPETGKACESLYGLPIEEFKKLNEQLERLSSFSMRSLLSTKPWKTFNWHRLWALPHEADAIKQYWKLYQMIAHLSALQFCLDQALGDNSLN